MNKINEIFDLMDRWRNFPSYQLERRVDIFFALYMKEILEIKNIRKIEAIIPEFPVRVMDVSDNIKHNMSYKIDYIISHDGNKVTFVELKTDRSSRRDKQDKYLLKSKEVGFKKLLEGLTEIYGATKAINKYRALLDELVKHGFLEIINNNQYSAVDQSYVEDILYIQPQNDDADENVITFREIAEKLKGQDEVAERFSQSLFRWSDSKAGG